MLGTKPGSSSGRHRRNIASGTGSRREGGMSDGRVAAILTISVVIFDRVES